ncbi:MAG: sensor histidine kinase [Deinococcales bacterium]
MVRRVHPVIDTGADLAEAERRTHELDTLHRLAEDVADTLDARDVLARSLTVLLEMGWFTCGEAMLRTMPGGPLETVTVGLCPFYDSVDACPQRPDLLARGEAALAGGVVARDSGWLMVPVDGEALLALSGGDGVSSGFLGAVNDLIRSSIHHTHLHERLAEKEQQRSRLLQAFLTAQEEERGRISRDLHDQIGQALTALLLGLDQNIDHPDTSSLRRLKELTSVTLTDVRRIALDLRPSVLDELGLEAGIRRYARDVHERYGLDVSVLVNLPGRLEHQEEIVLYRVVQEGLTNVVRHASARGASVVVTSHNGYVQCVIEDDGIGFDEAALLPGEQVGLMGMRERLEVLSGSLRIEATPGEGTALYARVPVR